MTRQRWRGIAGAVVVAGALILGAGEPAAATSCTMSSPCRMCSTRG